MAKRKLTKEKQKELISLLLIGKDPANIIEYFYENYQIKLSHAILSYYKNNEKSQKLREEVGKSVYSIMPFSELGNSIKQLKEIKKHITKIDNVIDKYLEGNSDQTIKTSQSGIMENNKFIPLKSEKAIRDTLIERKLEKLLPFFELKNKYLKDAFKITSTINENLRENNNNSGGFSLQDLYDNIDSINDVKFEDDI